MDLDQTMEGKGRARRSECVESKKTDREQKQTPAVDSSRAALPQHWLRPAEEFPLIKTTTEMCFWPTELRRTLPADTDPDVNTRTHEGTRTHTSERRLVLGTGSQHGLQQHAAWSSPPRPQRQERELLQGNDWWIMGHFLFTKGWFLGMTRPFYLKGRRRNPVIGWSK